MDSRKLFNKQDRKDKKKKDKKEKERKKQEEQEDKEDSDVEAQEPEQKRSRKSSKISDKDVPVAAEAKVTDEVNYLDEKEKKAEMLMEADKQNDASKDEKAPIKADNYFSETKFTDLNMSE